MAIPILSVTQMRAWEMATWQTGQSESAVICLVGKSIAEHALRLTRSGDFILLLAGKGHNGDDVRSAREHILDRRIDLIEVDSPAGMLDPLEAALRKTPALLVDGLFGIGVNRPLDDPWKNFIERINSARIPVLSVDVPSGLNADTGEAFGAAVQATVTLTVGAPKRGLIASGAERFVGKLEVATDVGLSPCSETAELIWTLPQDFTRFPPTRPVAGHKGAFGHVAVVAGSFGFHGAAVLAARGAQRGQPGLITLFTQELAYHAIAPQLQAVMVKLWDANIQFATEFTATLIGPGLAARDLPEEMNLFTRKLWRDSLAPVIVDASALDWLPLGPVPRNGIRVVTPHPGEAARLLKTTTQAVQQDRPRALREISKHFGNCWVVLKGHHTLIGRNEGAIFVNSSGNPHLAQGGSGDLLAGFIAGLLAQPALQFDVAKALSYAVWQHGASADALNSRRKHWVVEDLAAELGNTRP